MSVRKKWPCMLKEAAAKEAAAEACSATALSSQQRAQRRTQRKRKKKSASSAPSLAAPSFESMQEHPSPPSAPAGEQQTTAQAPVVTPWKMNSFHRAGADASFAQMQRLRLEARPRRPAGGFGRRGARGRARSGASQRLAAAVFVAALARVYAGRAPLAALAARHAHRRRRMMC